MLYYTTINDVMLSQDSNDKQVLRCSFKHMHQQLILLLFFVSVFASEYELIILNCLWRILMSMHSVSNKLILCDWIIVLLSDIYLMMKQSH